jgi:hypothetical protein
MTLEAVDSVELVNVRTRAVKVGVDAMRASAKRPRAAASAASISRDHPGNGGASHNTALTVIAAGTVPAGAR